MKKKLTNISFKLKKKKTMAVFLIREDSGLT